MNSAVKLLDRAASLWGERTALTDETQSLTFGAWRDTALRIGSGLLDDPQTAAGAPIIVYLPKSARALTAFMGVLYSGAPYVPVDAHIPMARLQKIIDNLSPAAVLTEPALAGNLDKLERGVPVRDLETLAAHAPDRDAIDTALRRVIDTDPIYVMYTSGSTGAPKGVTIPHRGVIDYARWVCETFSFGTDTVMANQAPFYFDNSVFDIYGTLQSGAHLELIPESLFLFPSKLPEFLESRGVTSIFWVPTVIINVANTTDLTQFDLSRLKNVSFCGEIMPNKQLNIWRRALPHCKFANLYGPTEITDVCTYYRVERDFADTDPLPIGRACENMRIVILNDEGAVCKTGETGELCVRGAGVALGYWNAWDISDRAFAQNPTHNLYYDRLYHTGDLGYISERGEIEFIGRRDTQIKLKGNRIELGELENAAMCVPDVTRACAIFFAEREEIALVIESENAYKLRPFLRQLRQYVPGYMLPAHLTVMPRLPMTANDKIDRVTLRGMIEKELEGTEA